MATSTRQRLAGVLLSLGVLACGSQERTPEPTQPVERAALPAEEVVPGAAGCPPGSEAARLEIPATQTLLRWCQEEDAEGEAVRQGPFERRIGGVTLESGEYRDGRRQGRWTLFAESGRRQSEGEYRDGRRVGVWGFWDERGELIREVDYGTAQPAEPVERAERADGEAAEERPRASRAKPVFVLIENAQASDVVVRLEPSGEEHTLAPGAAAEFEAAGPGQPTFRVGSADGQITLRAWEGSQLELSAEIPAPR